MSDPRGHPDPDPAALDELLRAFGDGAAGSTDTGGPRGATGTAVTGSATRRIGDVGRAEPDTDDDTAADDTDTAADDTDTAADDTDDDTAGDDADGRGGGDRGRGDPADGWADEDVEPHHTDGEDPDEDVEPHHTDGEDPDEDASPVAPSWIDDPGAADDRSGDASDGSAGAPPASGGAARPDGLDHDGPEVIVIDDYAGRPDAPPRAPVPARAEADDDVERVVIAVDDELPDAVYVQGSLDHSVDRRIVLIEDDGIDEPMQHETDSDLRRDIEPRLRERRVAVKRAEGRKRLWWVLAALGVVLVVIIALSVLGSGLFAIQADRVAVTGNVYTDEERLAEIVDDLVGTPTLLVDTGAVEEQLEEIPWVERARVEVDFPHTATIDIREREAWTTYAGPDGRYRVLDREGRVLAVLDGYPFAYVLIGGPDPVDLEPGEFAPRGYAAASELAKNFTPSVRGRVTMIEVTADGSRLVLVLDDGTRVRFGEARDLLTKLVRLETVLNSDLEREGDTIDVSTDEVTL